MFLTQASKSPGASTILSKTVWILVTKFNSWVCSFSDGVKSWFLFSRALVVANKEEEIEIESMMYHLNDDVYF